MHGFNFYLKLITLLLIASFFVCVTIIDEEVLERVNLVVIWYVIYLLSIIYIINRVKKGKFYEPAPIILSSYLLLISIGVILFESLRSKDYSNLVLNIVGVGFLSLCAGLWVSQNVNINSISYNKLNYIKIEQLKNKKIFISILALSLIAVVLLYLRFGGIPMLSGNVSEAKLKFLSGAGYLNVFFIALPLLSFSILYNALINGDVKNVYVSHLLMVLIVVLLLGSGYRAKTLIFLMSYISLLFFLRPKKIPVFLVVSLFAFLIIALGSIGAFRRGVFDLSGVTAEIAIILTARPAILQLIVANFNESNFFYGARYFYDFAKFLPGSQTGANVDLKYQLFANADKMPDSAGITPSIVGEAYMNFGFSGVFIIMFLVGMILGYSYKLARMKMSYGSIVFYLTLVLGMAGAIQSGIGTKIIHFIFIWFWLFIITYLHKKYITFEKYSNDTKDTYNE